jgi:hypothetical protein
LGNNDYCKTIKDGKSSKQKKTEKLILGGADQQIIPKQVFYDLVLGGMKGRCLVLGVYGAGNYKGKKIVIFSVDICWKEMSG